jgi:hypothetical protein
MIELSSSSGALTSRRVYSAGVLPSASSILVVVHTTGGINLLAGMGLTDDQYRLILRNMMDDGMNVAVTGPGPGT